ncbi:CHAT domain-containing protein [Dictyobacter arantiisoli]|uniref:CHAT domain-containing protein n=1 Tax=Dictyobacter arantiisoli TaxID=2014874 RepID=A0A5A5TF14_9CHLR|nr:CHAT domain-containing protein [Dictyobacter arantiisoli]GCF09736.1 hypothetical protein KDI_33000 [Dictyobacter arantiisoli]
MSDTNNTNFNGPINNSGSLAIGPKASIHNYAQPQPQPQSETTQHVKTTNALFVLSNPRGSNSLRLNTEMRAIEEALRLSPQRDRIQSRTLHAATANDLRRALLEKPYQIIHLSGHGGSDGFMLEDEQGRPHLVSPQALAAYFGIYRQTLRCVLLNACYTFSMGQHIALGIPYVIAMPGPIQDRASIEFSRGFYDAIGAGLDIERAYLEGLSTVRFAHLDHNFLALLLQE